MSTARVVAIGREPLADPRLYRELVHRYLVWDAFVGGARRVDLHPIVLPRALHDQAARVAEDVVRVVGRVADRAHVDEAERARYALSPDAARLAAASFAAGDRATLARVDLLLGDDGRFRACEINADCPGGHNETVALPRLARAAGFHEATDPTDVVARFVDRARELARGRAVALLYATAYAEDLQVCAFLKRALERRGVRAVLAPPTAPRFGRSGLEARGVPIGVLYRYFPTEYMEGQKNASDIASAIACGEVRSIASFADLFLQSKTAFARAWSRRAELSQADRAVVERSLPETLDLAEIDRSVLVAEREAWVVKKAFGRVGDEVFVGSLLDAETWRVALDESMKRRSTGEPWIAQRFVKQRPIETPWGERLVTLGAYVVDGRFAGYFARLTPESHVSHDALVLPVFAEVA